MCTKFNEVDHDRNRRVEFKNLIVTAGKPIFFYDNSFLTIKTRRGRASSMSQLTARWCRASSVSLLTGRRGSNSSMSPGSGVRAIKTDTP